MVKKLVSCEKKEIYNDVEILVRMSSLESSVLKLSSVCEKLCGEVLELKSGIGSGSGSGSGSVMGKKVKKVKKNKKGVKGGKKVVKENVLNIKQKKMSEYV